VQESQPERPEGSVVSAGDKQHDKSVEVLRTPEKVVRIIGDWAVHTFLDEDGNELHSIGFPREPLFSEEDIAESQAEPQLI
jgi:hypothetical protein